MQSSQKLDEAMLEKIETNYSKFINDYTNFIIEYLLNMNYSNLVIEDLSEAEKQLAQSLFLIEKLHMYLFHNISYYQAQLPFQVKNHPFNTNDSNSNYDLFRRLQELISNYHFSEEHIKSLCVRMISQILNYYPRHSVKIIVSDPKLPWKPNNPKHNHKNNGE